MEIPEAAETEAAPAPQVLQARPPQTPEAPEAPEAPPAPQAGAPKPTFRFFPTAQVRLESVVAGSFRPAPAWILSGPRGSESGAAVSNSKPPLVQGPWDPIGVGVGPPLLLERILSRARIR